jgi:hypothetical protein
MTVRLFFWKRALWNRAYNYFSRLLIYVNYLKKEEEQFRLPLGTSTKIKKSKKYKNGEFSVDTRTRQLTEGNNILTENSSSLNKSKPSRKTSIKQPKKHK